MYFNNYIKDTRNQACLELGFAKWKKEFYPQLKKRVKCSRRACTVQGMDVQCEKCDAGYCSEECKHVNSEAHREICAISNPREVLEIDSFLGWRLSPILSMIAITKNKELGPGILNVRVYESVYTLLAVPDRADIIKSPEKYSDLINVYITYITLQDWKERYTAIGKRVPKALSDINFKHQMVVNFDMESMNKNQLHTFPLLDLVKTEAAGLEEFMTDPISKLSLFNIPVPI